MANQQLDQLIHLLNELHASDLTSLDVRDQTAVTDFMVVCSGRSSRHVRAIAEQLIEKMKAAGTPALSASGLDNGEWALIDLGDFVVHVMQPETRAFYNIESLWKK